MKRLLIQWMGVYLSLLHISCADSPSPIPNMDKEIQRLESSLRLVADIDNYALLGTWGHNGDVWFAGGTVDSGNTSTGIIARYRSGKITRANIPEGPLLWWVFGFDSSTIWSVGEGGRILRRTEERWIEEYNFEDDKAILYGIWGASPTDLWAVGGSVRRNGPKGLVLRSKGDGRWTRVKDPAFPEDLNLYKVWGKAKEDVMLVGEGGVAIHWNGREFKRQDTGVSTSFSRFMGSRLAMARRGWRQPGSYFRLRRPNVGSGGHPASSRSKRHRCTRRWMGTCRGQSRLRQPQVT